MTSVVLNGHSYDSTQFQGWGYTQVNPDTGMVRFPDSIFTDMLAELASSAALLGLSPGTAGNVIISDGAAWRRSQDGAYPIITLSSITATSATLGSDTANDTYLTINSAAAKAAAVLMRTAGTNKWATGRGAADGSNNWQVYDYGSGVTALAITATTRLISAGGSFIAAADATYDVGDGSHRFRDFYLSRNATIGGTITAPTLVTGASAPSSPIKIDRLSDATTYGVISFNGTVTSAGVLGIFGRANAGEGLYHNVPTGYHHYFAGNNVVNVTISDTGAISGITTLAGTGAVSGFTTLSLSGANSFAIGNVGGVQRIQWGSDAANAFSLLNTGGGRADLYTGAIVAAGAVSVPTATNVYFDGGGDTYMLESSANNLTTVVGNVSVSTQKVGGLYMLNNVGIYINTTNGTNVADDSFIIIKNNRFVWGNNAANTSNYKLIGLNASDQVQIDSNGQSVTFGGNIRGTYWEFAINANTNGYVARTDDLDSGVHTNESIRFLRNGFKAGDISTTLALVTTYNSVSDGRIKRELAEPMPGLVLSALKIRYYERWLDGSREIGVFAQEAYGVTRDKLPGFVTVGGEEVDSRGIPLNPWQVDWSKMGPELVLGWQDHETRIAALESKAKAA
jgi:hypothetical protein